MKLLIMSGPIDLIEELVKKRDRYRMELCIEAVETSGKGVQRV